MDEKEAEARPVMGTIFLVYSTRKAFLEKAVVELPINLTRIPTTNV